MFKSASQFTFGYKAGVWITADLGDKLLVKLSFRLQMYHRSILNNTTTTRRVCHNSSNYAQLFGNKFFDQRNLFSGLLSSAQWRAYLH